jgi:hypothetical protein
MKWIFAFLICLCTSLAFAQTPVTAPPLVVASPAPQVVAPASPISTVNANAVAQNPDAAPPAWATEFLVFIEKLPVVGPYVGTIMMYLGILGALMTALVAFLLSVANALKAVTTWAGLANFAALIQTFQQSKIMYWLTTLSLFNAKAPPAQQSLASAVTKAST